MSRPVDLVLARLEQFKLRPNGPNRWRACCPAHGGSNPSALSIGVGQNDAVLLKCWSGCSTDEVAHALGLELHELFPPRPEPGGGSAPMQRRHLLTSRQALDLLHDEAQLIALCGSNVAHGVELTDDDRDRCLAAAGRVAYLLDEVLA